MADLFDDPIDVMVKDEAAADDVVSYKPISPTATVSLIVGIAAVIAAAAVYDLGWGFLMVPAAGFLLGLKGLSSVRRYGMAGRGAARAAVLLSTLAAIVGTGVHIYQLKTLVPPDYAPITYEPLQSGPDGPAKSLDGKKVFIQGYMYPTNKVHKLTRFVLCRDNGTCCFGGQPKLVDMVEVKVKPGLTLDHTSSLRGIGGVFRTKAETDPGGLGQIVYHIEDADVLH